MTHPPNIPFLIFCASATAFALGRAWNHAAVVSANRQCELHKAERAKLALRNIWHVETIEDLRGQLRELSEQLTAANEHAEAMQREALSSVFRGAIPSAVIEASAQLKR